MDWKDPLLLGLVYACIFCGPATISRAQELVKVYPSILEVKLQSDLVGLLKRDLFDHSVSDWLASSLPLLNDGHGRLIRYFQNNEYEIKEVYFNVACVCVLPPDLNYYMVLVREFKSRNLCEVL